MDAAGGSLSFARFMTITQFDPQHGYYSTRIPFGRKGDFITAPELSPLFAQCMADTFGKILLSLEGGDIVEYGGGSGVFARDVLLALEAAATLPDHYWLIETSSLLKQTQQQLLKTACPHLLSRIHWTETPPPSLRGIIFANELLDALPFHRVRWENGQFAECCVTFQNGQLAWQFVSPSPALANALASLPSLPENCHTEIRPNLPAFVQTMAQPLTDGLLLLVDYGYGRPLYCHPARTQGTLACFYHHHVHDNPLLWPGLQDITAHVDFTAVAEGLVDAGLSLTGFTTQAAFLLASGITEKPADPDPAKQWEMAQAMKTLLLPCEMGETIRVMGASPTPGLTLPALTYQDRRRDL